MEEIDLKELIVILVKERKLIIAIVGVFFVLALIYALMRTKVYEATLTLMTSSISQATNINTSSVDAIVDSANDIYSFPNMDVNTYKEQFLNPEVLQATIDELQLTKANGDPMAIESLAGMVELDIPEETALLNVTVKNKDPELAANIANALGHNFTDFISAKGHQSADESAITVAENLKTAEANLEAEAERRINTSYTSESIGLMHAEIDMLSGQITDYKSSLNTLNKDIPVLKNSLEAILNGGQNVTSLDLGALDLSISGAGQGDYTVPITDANQLQNAMLTMKATDIETQLVSSLEQQKSITTELTKLEDRLGYLQSEVIQAQYKYDSMMRDYSMAESTYTAYQTKAKEITVSSVADIGKTSIQVSSDAVPPGNPSNLGGSLVLIIAIFLGLVVGIFAAFFRYYWWTDLRALVQQGIESSPSASKEQEITV